MAHMGATPIGLTANPATADYTTETTRHPCG
jgi:hypothetical protein